MRRVDRLLLKIQEAQQVQIHIANLPDLEWGNSKQIRRVPTPKTKRDILRRNSILFSAPCARSICGICL